jgi:23S rRNA (cytidine1920-2'-O)/16S rRNA (cytidine1409-2'-O)-methyltransferase
VGSSTGGFSEVLLDRGASSVVALDVGNNQLHESLRSDPRVVVMEGTNIRHIDPGTVGAPFDLVVVDLSFISLRLVVAELASLVSADGDLLLLVKPQFEVQRRDLGKGGILRNEGKRSEVVSEVAEQLDLAGLAPQGLIQSPVEGGDGNTEFLLWCRVGARSQDLEVPA